MLSTSIIYGGSGDARWHTHSGLHEDATKSLATQGSLGRVGSLHIERLSVCVACMLWPKLLPSNFKLINTYLALCSDDSLLFSSAWSLSISFFFLSILRSASIPALACVNLSLLYSFSCSSSCCFSLCKEKTRTG